ncbi:redoxin domain-containing protein [Pedobacter sp. UC225_61]|uniref:redoxin domain-containing protein n=1 Tax=Pedobacter sp. UC225_61 TaxID=3374623 RepID=UPI00378B40CD
MKKIGLLLIVALYCLSANSQNTIFTINGTINGKNEGYIYLSYTDKNGQPKTDSSAITNQSFLFKGEINEPQSVSLRSSLRIRNMDDPNFATFFIEPSNMKLEITQGDYKNFILRGSKTQEELNELTKLKAPINTELKKYTDAYKFANDAYIKAVQAKLPQDQQDALHKKANDIRDQFAPFTARKNLVDYAFISKNPNSYISVYFLRFKLSGLPLDSIQLFYNAFTPKIKESAFGKQISAEIEKLKKGSPGAIATIFTSTDINGQPLSLADFKGKYVLLDFWASWCVPCREGNPHLKTLYTTYKDKGFEIIGISDDDTKPENWRNAVNQDQIGIWKHVLRGLKRTSTGFDRTNDISENFGIYTLPTKILIDKDGKIIGRYGEGEVDVVAMDKKLAEVLGK